MEFSFTEDQVAIRDLCNQILADHATDERLREFAAGNEGYDKALWQLFAEAGLLGMAVPEAFGGSGFGLTELCLMLEEQGRFVAPIPLAPSLVLAGLPIAEFGSDKQKDQYLAPLAAGQHILTAAVSEAGMPDALQPETVAVSKGDGWVLNGTKLCVPYAKESKAMLLPAVTADGNTVVFLLDSDTAGVALEYQQSTNGEPLYTVTLTDVELGADNVLVGAENGADAVEWIVARGNAALAATQVGITEEALRRTAEYTSERKQFGRSIASFQGISLRCADAYIDIEAIRSTYWQAVWRLTEGLPAEAEVRAAKWWACVGGGRVVHTAQHLHGGIGSDIDYPLHRYFLWAKQVELSLGGGSLQLASLGALFASEDSVVNVI